MSSRDRTGTAPPDPTLADLKQLGWGLLLIYALIAVLAALSRHYFGPRTAVWVGVGLAAFVTAAFVLITAASLLVSYGADAIQWHRRRRASGRIPLRGRRDGGDDAPPAA